MVLVSDRRFGGADTYATSYTLAQAVRALGGFDLILCGRQAIDGDTAQVGPMLAEHLGLPQLTCACAITIEDGAIRIRQEGERASTSRGCRTSCASCRPTACSRRR